VRGKQGGTADYVEQSVPTWGGFFVGVGWKCRDVKMKERAIYETMHFVGARFVKSGFRPLWPKTIITTRPCKVDSNIPSLLKSIQLIWLRLRFAGFLAHGKSKEYFVNLKE
jgi:hypothetical protein